ncbi:XRE family transcriptional regulator [Xylanibacillus composti]|uniref:HTH cro/C1-type domain-containing protein n=1 Tax=Xylanibacillus composti TaxID=1572762 RepID=A0A8J4GZ46_9BACL|nr:helix-turn-helix transcriptional regulator [Xylanibacillus composti]MDT9724318.1 XRE family transcriptional regulator [Xylanibacillus composti]GIQ67907.1 hypothetical protein XYCOK13_07310 [Xylanibacillus composti]
MEEILKQVGARIRSLRKEKGMSQEDLAELIDTSHSYIGYVERGEQNITLLTLEKIATALGVEAKELLAYQGLPYDQRVLEAIKLLDGKSEEDLKRAVIVLKQLYN